MRRRDVFGLMALASAGPLAVASSTTGSATPLPSALDAAGQLNALPLDGTPGGFRWRRVAEGVQFRIDSLTKGVLFYGPGLVRVTAHLGVAHTAQPSLVVVARPRPLAIEVREEADTLRVVAPGVQVLVDKRSGALTFLDGAGRLLTRERERAPTELQQVEIAGLVERVLAAQHRLRGHEAHR